MDCLIIRKVLGYNFTNKNSLKMISTIGMHSKCFVFTIRNEIERILLLRMYCKWLYYEECIGNYITIGTPCKRFYY